MPDFRELYPLFTIFTDPTPAPRPLSRRSRMKPFPGIDDTGTWVLALICGDCGNPAPWYLTILEPCSR